MSSPDRMEMLANAIGNLVQAMRLMDAEQQSHDRRIQAHEGSMQAHERWIQAHEEWMRAHNEWMRDHNEWVRGVQAESRQNRERISEILGLPTNMQADIARLDAAS